MIESDYKKEQQRIFDELAKSPPLLLRSIGREREHRLGWNFYRYLHHLKTKGLFDILQVKKGSSILDMGCYDGEMLNSLYLAYGTKGVGIDFSIGALKNARKYNLSMSKYCLGDVDRLPFKDNSFDYIISFSMLEHLPGIDACIREMSRVLKRNGKVIIYTLNSRYRYGFRWFMKKIFLSRYSYDPGAGHAHHPDYFVHTLNLEALFEANNIKVNKIIYFHAFFTMLYDDLAQRTIYRLICLLYLIKRYLVKNINSREGKPDIILKGYNWWLKLLLPVFEFMDRPLSRRGYSNGFYVLARKE